MRIAQFAEKYGIDTRTVDYWTTIGLIHADRGENGFYREYGDQAEREIKTVLIAQAMNTGCSIEECTDLVRHTPKCLIDEIIVKKISEEMDKVTAQYKRALAYVSEMRD